MIKKENVDKRYREERKIAKYLILIIAILVSLNFLLIFINSVEQQGLETGIKEQNNFNTTLFFSRGNVTHVEIKVPAVDNEGKGVPTILSVEVKRGDGKTLVNIENLLFWADTQQSIRMARYVAGNITGKNLDNYDLTYSIKANASIIGGPSAGAAITIATIFALEGIKPREDVMITGTINHDGTIGPVSAVLEKAKASKKAGAKIFLVPLLQSRDVIYETTQHCQKFGYTEVCTKEIKPKKIDVSDKAGIEVKEVGTIQEALQYFLPKNESLMNK